jgi:single-strand DNA-binding protein
MSIAINCTHLAGNLTRDPQMRFLANEKAVCNFGLAVNRKWKDANGAQKEEVTFIDVSAWGRTAELCGQYLAKGAPCYVQGRLHLETWDDKATGQKRSKLVVVADNVQFLGQKGDRPANAEPAAEQTQEAPAAPRRPAAPSGGGDDGEPPFQRRGEWE